jgi:PmbA protein
MEDIKNVVKNVVKDGFEFEIYVSEASKSKIDIEDKALDRVEASKEQGVGIRLIKGSKVGFSYTTKLTKDDVERCTKMAMDIALSQDTEDDITDFILKEPKENKNHIELYDKTGLTKSKEEKISKLIKMEDDIKAYDPRINLVRDLSYTESTYTYLMENSYGVKVEETMSGFFVMGCAIAKDKEDTSSGCSYMGSRFLEDIDFETLSKEIAINTVSLLNPKSFETKSLPVVFSQDSMVSLLRTFSSIFLGDALIKNRTMLKDRLNEQIASQEVNIIDDGTIDRALGSSRFDADGNPTQKNVVLENGVFKSFLHNIYTAKKSNQQPTANSVRAGYKSVPQTGIHNFYLVPKNNSLETLLGAYEDCVYITELMGLHMADPISGNFSLGASGIVYKNGKPSYPIRAVTVASNFLELLKKVKLIGNDFRFFGHVGSPSVLVEEITIGGM